MTSPAHRPVRRGFTLVELMVATSIMVVIVLAVVTIASDTFKAYDRAVADLSTQSEARGVLDAMENDFQSAVIRADNHCWMEIVMPGATAYGAPAGTPPVIGNMQTIDQPIIMLFASPPDRPRWSPDTATRRQLKGDVCAIAYRLGQRSPFDAPGDLIQQVYGVYRTIIDPESTFNEALPIILAGTTAAPKSPWDYWATGTHQVAEYAPLSGSSGFKTKTLVDANISSATPCWTLDDQNFIGSNVVSMSIVLWCTSSLPATPVAPALGDPVKRMSSALRPVAPATVDTYKYGSTAFGGYPGSFRSATAAATTAAAPIRYAASGAVTLPIASPTAATIHPYDYFGGRLRVFADRMYPDAMSPSTLPTATSMPYLPYTLRAVEVSITILTPEGSKELRGLQQLGNNAKLTDANAYKRIVNQYGRNYTRYIRLLSNGG